MSMVARLDVLMDQSRLVRGVKPPGALYGYIQDLVEANEAARLDRFVDGLAFDQLRENDDLRLHGPDEPALD
jgi:hypothetical protein